MSGTLERAETEIAWFFLQRASALGMAAQNYEGFGGGGPAIWDSARIHAAHMRHRTSAHRRAMRKEQEITPTIAQLDSALITSLATAFCPPPVSTTLWSAFAEPKHAVVGSLVGLAFQSLEAMRLVHSIRAAMAAALAKAAGGPVSVDESPARREELVHVLEDLAHTAQAAQGKQSTKAVQVAKEHIRVVHGQARERYGAAVVAYHDLMVVRSDARRASRAQEIAEIKLRIAAARAAE